MLTYKYKKYIYWLTFQYKKYFNIHHKLHHHKKKRHQNFLLGKNHTDCDQTKIHMFGIYPSSMKPKIVSDKNSARHIHNVTDTYLCNHNQFHHDSIEKYHMLLNFLLPLYGT